MSERHHRAKISEEDVNLIIDLSYEREDLEERLKEISTKALADRFGISRQRVWDIYRKHKEENDG